MDPYVGCVFTDVTTKVREKCEDKMRADGTGSPYGTTHVCASCGTRQGWSELRWVWVDRPSGRSYLISGVHDCPKFPDRLSSFVRDNPPS